MFPSSLGPMAFQVDDQLDASKETNERKLCYALHYVCIRCKDEKYLVKEHQSIGD